MILPRSVDEPPAATLPGTWLSMRRHRLGRHPSRAQRRACRAHGPIRVDDVAGFDGRDGHGYGRRDRCPRRVMPCAWRVPQRAIRPADERPRRERLAGHRNHPSTRKPRPPPATPGPFAIDPHGLGVRARRQDFAARRGRWHVHLYERTCGLRRIRGMCERSRARHRKTATSGDGGAHREHIEACSRPSARGELGAGAGLCLGVHDTHGPRRPPLPRLRVDPGGTIRRRFGGHRRQPFHPSQ
jgi:hypothetical protein